MWIGFAICSAFFAGITSILAKSGIKNTDSNVATAIRTIVVLICAWIMILITGAQEGIREVSAVSLIFLILSGIATGASWLCYFKALQIGDINKVVPIDKSSTVLSIIMAFIFLKERISVGKLIGIIGITVGTFLMINKADVKDEETKEDNCGNSKKAERCDGIGGLSGKKGRSWFVYAVLSAIFASATSILGKVGVSDIDSNLGTGIRTIVVLIMAWLMVLMTGKLGEVKKIGHKELLFIILSGAATGASWLCYYRALKDGQANVVVPIDKLSILVTVAFSYVVFKEKLSVKAFAGLVLITAGTLLNAVM